MLNISTWAALIVLAACSGHLTDKPHATFVAGSSSESNNTETKVVIDSVELAKIYSMAISNYVEAVFQKDKVVFDTLFFGKRKNGQPDDFPDIELPDTIHGAKVFLLTEKEAKANKQLYRKSSPYINLIGWVDRDKAGFTFVTFFPDFQHQYDCYIDYKYNTATNEFELEQLRIAVLILDKDGKADHFAIYEDGKHIGDKPIH